MKTLPIFLYLCLRNLKSKHYEQGLGKPFQNRKAIPYCA